MKRFLYSLTFLLCTCLGLRAQDPNVYNPENPPEPEPNQTLYTLALETNPSGTGYYYGNGRYTEDGLVYVYAYAYSDYVFKAWMEGDSVVSTNYYFSYTMPKRDVKLTAHFEYYPSDPAEPTVPVTQHTLRLFSQLPSSGYFSNGGVSSAPDGQQFWVYAYPYSDYVFRGWYKGDSLISTTYYLLYTMGAKDDTIVGRFEYEPSNPYEPNGSNDARYNLSVLRQTANPGETIPFPIFLMNENLGVHSLVFDVQMPQGCRVSYRDATLSSRKNGHVLSSDSIGPNTYRFTVSSTESLPLYGSSGTLLTLPVTLPLEWDALDTIHSVTLSNAVLYSTLGTLYCPVKNGLLDIVSDTTTLYASFYPDMYLNRVKFSNLSSAGATSYFWQFGDGATSTEKNPLHVYESSGFYDVTLKVTAGMKVDSIVMKVSINDESSWKMEGHFTLDPQRSETKNFTSLQELFSLMARTTVVQDVMIQVLTGPVTELVVDGPMATGLDRIGKQLLLNGRRIQFYADSLKLLNVTDLNNQLEFEVLKTLSRSLTWNHVGLSLFGTPVDFAPILTDPSQTICSGTWTQPVDMSRFSPDLTVHARLIGTPLFTNGFDLCAEDTLPAMMLVNDSTLLDSLKYETYVQLADTAFILNQIRISILPTLHGELDLQVPNSGAELYGRSVQFMWTPIVNAKYDLYLWDATETVPTKPFHAGLTSNYSYTSDLLQYGRMYKWKVVAYGTCNQLESTVDSFTVRTLPDLQVAEAVVPTVMNAGEPAEFRFRIVNKGGNSDYYYSYDKLCLATDSTMNKLLMLNTQYHYGYTAKDSSYWVVYQVTMPYDSLDYTRVVLVIDDYKWILESDETNNTWLSGPVQLLQPTMDEADYQKLCVFYQQTSGSTWNQHWDTSRRLILASNWPGVTFHRGRVIGVNLQGFGLAGTLPASIFTLDLLKSLNLSYNQLGGSLTTLRDSMAVLDCHADSLTDLNLSYNEFEGDLSAFAIQCRNLTSLNVAGNRLSRIDQPLPQNIRSISLGYERFEVPDFRLSMTPQVQIPSLCWYNQTIQGPDLSWLVFAVYKGNQNVGQLEYFNGAFHLAVWGHAWNHEPDATFTLMQTYGLPYGSTAMVKIPFSMGDANIDDAVNVLDVQHSLNYIFLENPQPFNYYGANTYPDDAITVQDIVRTVNLVLASPDTVLAPVNAPSLRSAVSESQLEISGNQLMLNASVPVSALDVTLRNVSAKQVRLLLNQTKFQWISRATTDGVRFVIFSPNGETLALGDNALVELQANGAEIVAATLSDRQANAVPLRFSTNAVPSRPVQTKDFRVQASQGLVTIDLEEQATAMTANLYNAQGLLLDTKSWTNVPSGRQTLDYTSLISGGVYILKLDVNRGETHLNKNVKLIVSK